MGPGVCALDSGEGPFFAVAWRESRGGSVFLLLNKGDGLLTMSDGSWNGWDECDGSVLLLLNSGLGTSSLWEPKWYMGGPTISISGFFAGVGGNDLRY